MQKKSILILFIVMAFLFSGILTVFAGQVNTVILDNNKYLLIKPQFDEVDNFSEGLAAVCKKDKWGFIDKNGKLVIDFKFDEVGRFSEGLAAVCVNNKWGFINRTGNIVIRPQFDEVSDFYGGLAAVCKDNKWGFINVKGNFVIKNQYDEISDMDIKNGLFIVVRKGNKFGVINRLGQQIIPFKYDLIVLVDSDIFIAKNNGKYGVINDNGQVVIPLIYDSMIKPFPLKSLDESDIFYSEGIFGVKKNNKWGYIDKTGKIIAEPKFENAKKFSEGLAAVKVNGKWGYIDRTGKMVIKPQFVEADDFQGGVAVVKIQSRGYFTETKLINKKGTFIKLPPGTISVRRVDTNLFEYNVTNSNGDPLVGLMDCTGKALTNALFFHIDEFSDGLALVTMVNNNRYKHGYIDRKGNLVINTTFAEAYPFDNGVALFSDKDPTTEDGFNRKYGFIDKKGKVILKPQFDSDTTEFHEGATIVEQDGKYGFFIVLVP
ncbi:KWG repeat protein [Caldicellulosiruptor acetigenus I77R1B]|uniref:KWG repeat protein n=1 Tax=Caldicellulosiruptor acetigenus (strain ATCC 700853 / DSM 12137 / I77R1B) TaxID=632335 RepID=E4S5R8_CALA7|nr:WG repeat-containing protein [Caldicellulosiruptor acetigenus]ADQ41578.1 KWG repeat protein [Caldicellulosiruptor acetigenus I77R1B]